jgi:hypothetical protein
MLASKGRDLLYNAFTPVVYKARVLVTVSNFHPSSFLVARLGAYPVWNPMMVSTWAPALPANIRLGWKRLTLKNDLAYHELNHGR